MYVFLRHLLAMTLFGIIPHLASEEVAPVDTAQWIQFDQWQPMNLASSYYSAYIDQEAKPGQRLSFWFDANFQGTDSVIPTGAESRTAQARRPSI